MDISKIHINPNNPRIIKDGKFEKLCRSIQEFPKMLELRPIIVDSDGMILGGNMRFKALQYLKMDIKPEWVKEGVLSDEEKRRFVVEDNVEFVGGKILVGYQLRYIYLIDKTCKLNIPILPYSKIDEMGAGMYRGNKITVAERHRAL